jgi:hypothetical protein
MTKNINVLNLGAGVQSTALYLMSMRDECPRFEASIFADTGEESAATYRHLAWLQSLNGPPILVRSIGGKLGDHLLSGQNSTGQRFASIPAFTKKAGSDEQGRTRRQCSKEYKVELIERTIKREVLGLRARQRVPKDCGVVQHFGISLDEAGRATRLWERHHIGIWRMSKTGTRRLVKAPFPPKFILIEKGMTRANCLDYLDDKVPHETPRSACVFCPFKTDEEWQRTRTVPEDWTRATQVDEGLRTTGARANRDMEQTMYVHRSCVPLGLVQLHPKVNPKELQLGFGVECEGVCGV